MTWTRPTWAPSILISFTERSEITAWTCNLLLFPISLTRIHFAPLADNFLKIRLNSRADGNSPNLEVNVAKLTREARLVTKFHWVYETTYRENRQRILNISAKKKKTIRDTFDHISEYVQQERLGTLDVDITILATALELEIPVVTDDQDMRTVAGCYKNSFIESF